jgi:two-component system, OmpR family, sensor histidine kinase KdpD
LRKSGNQAVKSNALLDRLNLKYSSTSRLRWQGVLFSLMVVSLSTALMHTLNLAPYNVNMAYMLLTLIATVWFGLGAGVVTALLAFLCFNFFFIPPYFTFAIDAVEGWMAVFLFFGTALFANQVAGRARLNSQEAQQREQEATALYELATAVITKVDQTEMLLAVLQRVSEALGTANCTLFLQTGRGDDQLLEIARIEPVIPEKITLPPRHPELALAQVVFKQNRPTFFPGQFEPIAAQQPASKGNVSADKQDGFGPVAYLPLASGSQVLGVMALVGHSHPRQLEFSPKEKRLIQVFANHVALAVEHVRLIREVAQVATLRDADKLKSALLASVSHELRTPLAAIKTATANLQSKDIEWTEEEQDEFLGMIEEETDRLTRLVSNVLDLSKIEAHALKPDFGWYYLPEIVEKVIERLQNSPVMRSHSVTATFAPDLPLTRMDYLQIDQVLTNLLENAAKYSLAGRPITVEVEMKQATKLNLPDYLHCDLAAEQSFLVVKVLDEGMGIPSAELERIFDKFYRVRSSMDGMVVPVPGTGIGLAISKGIVEAHGGLIWAQNRLYGGSVFTFILPVILLEDSRLHKLDELI